MTNVATLHLDDLKKELEEYKELASNRLQEIDKLNEEKAHALSDIDKLKMEVSESLFCESIDLKTHLKFLDETSSGIYHYGND